jgi:hypothetical protein
MLIISVDYLARCSLRVIWVGVFGWRQDEQRFLYGNRIIIDSSA